MGVYRWYRHPGIGFSKTSVLLSKLQGVTTEAVTVKELQTELCFYVEVKNDFGGLSDQQDQLLQWLLQTPFEDHVTRESVFNEDTLSNQLLVEIGPRLNFCTAFSTNAVSMCHSIGLIDICRIECSIRYLITCDNVNQPAGDFIHIPKHIEQALVAALHDKMTEYRYYKPIDSFNLDITPEPPYEVDIMGEGKAALQNANTALGLAFDEWDLDYYTKLFTYEVKRNPTNVECFDLSQSNSEHSRHWFFSGRLVIDGKEHEDSLFTMVKKTQDNSNSNNVIKFNDNSSGIEGYDVEPLYPSHPAKPAPFQQRRGVTRHIIFTAETHNFPTGVAPFPGATTGTGGRIRDVHCTGRGAHVIAGTAGYSFGNLHLPGYKLPWEDETFEYPPNFALPRDVAVQASDGASDYGNKFGEPVLTGFARSFGIQLPNGERREWLKPIMFSGGIGSLEQMHVKKQVPKKGMEVVKVGGPVYRIGVGGGAASSIQVQGDNVSELDFGAVQRGDAEMEQKMNRIIRGCIEMSENNPICSIHDQGAGGNGNVLKEISEPAGALIRAGNFQLGDPTLSILEVWGAEYQESNAMLVQSEDVTLLMKLGQREKCSVSSVGNITGDGKIRLEDNITRQSSNLDTPRPKKFKRDCNYPVDLDLELVLGCMPQKVFHLEQKQASLQTLRLPEGLTVRDALDRVLRLPSVASKRYLTNKVDRSVTGLVAQQQCVGPLHTPLADVAVIALSHFDTVGAATAIGEQPIKGLVDASCGARMTVGEALTNLVFAQISSLRDVKCSGNWMWPAKLPGEGALLYDACKAMCDVMKELGIAVDGGKDSLSMAARVGKETVKAPGALVVSVYAGCPDIRRTVTPDLKCLQGKGSILYVPLSGDHHRLGGSALAQCYKQIGDQVPDMDDPLRFAEGFNITQNLIKDGLLLSGHDVSDGGLITCLLEMAFAGNCGLNIDIPLAGVSSLDVLFAEELGLVLEVESSNVDAVSKAYETEQLICFNLGICEGFAADAMVKVSVNGEVVLNNKMTLLREIWEETSFQLEKLQTTPYCAMEEQACLRNRTSPPYSLTFDPQVLMEVAVSNGTVGVSNGIAERQPLVAVIREEGSNGDREMVSAFHMAGFQAWDVTMQDLCSGQITLDRFRGVVFVGGFSYADVMGSAKGWAATLKFNDCVRAEFDAFYQRRDTFSLGVCNGCQLMALLGWIAPDCTAEDNGINQGVHLTHNLSERFESRFVTVKIEDSPALMLQQMQGSILGIWVAHGEGRMKFKNELLCQDVLRKKLVSLKYVDDNGNPTESYPFNPNGSPDGIAGICSTDGRHLALMPHPERCILPWQWAWMPHDWNTTMKVSPWLCMFRNAYKWCMKSQI